MYYLFDGEVCVRKYDIKIVDNKYHGIKTMSYCLRYAYGYYGSIDLNKINYINDTVYCSFYKLGNEEKDKILKEFLK